MRGDGTGPNGQGPMTGRGLGYCAGYQNPGFVNNGFVRGGERGFRAGGSGRGFFRGGWGPVPAAYPVYSAPVPPPPAYAGEYAPQQGVSLEERKALLQKELERIDAELAKGQES